MQHKTRWNSNKAPNKRMEADGDNAASGFRLASAAAHANRSAKALMKIHRRFSVFGSRFLYFALVPWLLVCISLFPYMAFNFGSGISSVLLSAIVSTTCFVGVLVATDSWRFIRLTIALLLLVPVAYIWYFAQTFFADQMSFTPSLRVSQSTPFNALLGFLIWGVPSMIGARVLLQKARRISAVDAKRRLRRSRKKEPNQTLQPTPLLVTPRADARVAPSSGAADLNVRQKG